MNRLFEHCTRHALLIAAAWICGTASAQLEATPALPDSLGLSTNLVEVTLNLVLVLAAIIMLAWVFKRAQGFNQPAAGHLRVTATLPLGPKDRILLLEVGDKQIVVGSSSAGLNTLHVLETPLLQQAQVQEQAQESFRDKLLKSLRGSPS